MKAATGKFAGVFIDKTDRACCVYGTFEIYPLTAEEKTLKSKISGWVSYEVKNIESQIVISTNSKILIKILEDKWELGLEFFPRKWSSFQGELYETILRQVKNEYFDFKFGQETI